MLSGVSHVYQQCSHAAFMVSSLSTRQPASQSSHLPLMQLAIIRQDGYLVSHAQTLIQLLSSALSRQGA